MVKVGRTQHRCGWQMGCPESVDGLLGARLCFDTKHDLLDVRKARTMMAKRDIYIALSYKKGP
jgi:hypothetical protein